MLRWRSFGGVAVSTHLILPVKAAKTLIMDKCRSTAFRLHKMQTHKIVDTLLTLIFRLGQWPFRDHFCPERMPICWLWVHAIAEHLDFTWSNTQNHWHSVDNPLTLCWYSVDNLLMLCWRWVWGVAVSTHTISPIKAANTLIMDKCRITAVGLYKMQHRKLLTLCWLSFSDWGWDHVGFSFAHQGCQYVDYRYQRANGISMDLLTRPKTVDGPLTLTFTTCLLPCRFLCCL